jgi:hypothetical protein
VEIIRNEALSARGRNGFSANYQIRLKTSGERLAKMMS